MMHSDRHSFGVETLDVREARLERQDHQVQATTVMFLADVWIVGDMALLLAVEMNGQKMASFTGISCTATIHEHLDFNVQACVLTVPGKTHTLLQSPGNATFGAYTISHGVYVTECHALGMRLTSASTVSLSRVRRMSTCGFFCVSV